MSGRPFIIGIALNIVFIIAEVVSGLLTHSLALLSDAGHNLSDVAGLAISLVAFYLAKKKATNVYTYGYRKTTILAALFNAFFLLIALAAIGYEAIMRLNNPTPVAGGVVAWVAGLGIVINAASALLFFRNKEADLNAKSAYLHLLADAIVSLGVVIAGLVIRYTHWFWLDAAISLVIMVVILISTWSLLVDSLRLSLDGVPKGIDPQKIHEVMMKTAGVLQVDHVHIWAMSTTQNALTAHIVADNALSFTEKMKMVKTLKHALLHENIHHATIELQAADTQDACALDDAHD